MSINRPTDPYAAETERIKKIRRALQDAVLRRSLRAVAREIGMSPTGLRGFLDGTDSYRKTRAKALTWFARFGPEVDETEAREVGLEMLVRSISSDEARQRVRETVMAIVADPSRELLDRVERAIRGEEENEE